MNFIVLLDANVLYPAPLRDFLLTLATTGLYSAKWTDQIHDEWQRNLIKNRPELAGKLDFTRQQMNRALPNALVTDYEKLISDLNLPDPDDRHVLAAAIKCNAQVIVTLNLKDFPDECLEPYGIEALHPDHFLEFQFGLKPGLVIEAAKKQRARLNNPPRTSQEFLDRLSSQGLVITAEWLRQYANLI